MSQSIYTDASNEEIDRAYNRLKDKFATHATKSLAYRLYHLKQVAYMIHDNGAAICAAVKADLDNGGFAVQMTDLVPIINEVDLAVRRLATWMKDEYRVGDSMLSFKSMKPRIVKQPKGVVLNISPWNFPWQLTMIPLVNAIAAGCPMLIKPSEHSPRSSALMARLIPTYLDSEAYAVVLGGPDQSTYLLEKQWGHIMFTGSGKIGKIVAKAAAETLTPSTLELGGKSPVIVTECANLKIIARRMFSIKQLVNGQMCVAPDYILVAREKVDEFIKVCSETMDEFFPKSPDPKSLLHASMTSRQRSQGDFDRQMGFLEKAESEGKVVYRGETDATTRRMGFSLVKLAEDGKGESGGLVEQEIFGTVIPIIPYSSLDAAIKYINDRPHPLALYVCSGKRSILTKVLHETISGSVCWNEFGFATLARSLPFGGVGDSGWGSYHGYDGFKEFTHFKSTLEIPYYFEPLMSVRYPPISNIRKKIFGYLMYAGIPFSRPKSVEAEAKKLWWKKWRLTMILAVLIAGGVSSGTIAGAIAKVRGKL